jgi:hypothetical protein
MLAKCSTQLIFLELITLIIFGKKKTANCKAPHCGVPSSLLLLPSS